MHPAGADTRASGRAGSPALAKAHRVMDQAVWNRSTRRAGEQANFIIEPTETREYTIQTFGRADTLLVLFAERDGELRFMAATCSP